jgi:multicomponent Na+:H+ antiporter subunit F
MQTVLMVLCLVVLTSVLMGMVRVVLGPTSADRMLSVLLFGTSGVATLLLLGEATQIHALQDVALVFVVLAAVTAIAFVRLIWMPADKPSREDSS